EAKDQLDHLYALEQLVEMRRLIGGDVGAEHENRDLDGLIHDAFAHVGLGIARHVFYGAHHHIEQLVSRLVDRELGVNGHGGFK
ncbi:hypothetical protein BTE48_16445, partial [Oceanospirillum multiglobuliferum]